LYQHQYMEEKNLLYRRKLPVSLSLSFLFGLVDWNAIVPGF
jgi:hypothetical protein